MSDSNTTNVGIPIIDYPDDEITLEYHQTFTLICECKKPITWNKSIDIIEAPNIDITYEDTGFEEIPYRSILKIENATYKEVGEYYCVHKDVDPTVHDIELLKSEFKAQSIYVYVQGLILFSPY